MAERRAGAPASADGGRRQPARLRRHHARSAQARRHQAFVDPENLAALQAAALDKMKKFEFDLRKKADGGDQPLSLSGSDEVPAGFRHGDRGVLPRARQETAVTALGDCKS